MIYICIFDISFLISLSKMASGLASTTRPWSSRPRRRGLNLPQWNPRTVPSNAVHRPVGPTQNDSKNKKNEIFVDILERISVRFPIHIVLYLYMFI